MEIPSYEEWEKIIDKIFEKFERSEPIPLNLVAAICSEQKGILVKDREEGKAISIFIGKPETNPNLNIIFWKFVDSNHLKLVTGGTIEFDPVITTGLENLIDYWKVYKLKS